MLKLLAALNAKVWMKKKGILSFSSAYVKSTQVRTIWDYNKNQAENESSFFMNKIITTIKFLSIKYYIVKNLWLPEEGLATHRFVSSLEFNLYIEIFNLGLVGGWVQVGL
jgi:hypothetical protein